MIVSEDHSIPDIAPKIQVAQDGVCIVDERVMLVVLATPRCERESLKPVDRHLLKPIGAARFSCCAAHGGH